MGICQVNCHACAGVIDATPGHKRKRNAGRSHGKNGIDLDEDFLEAMMEGFDTGVSGLKSGGLHGYW